jgi:hypothetical protein
MSISTKWQEQGYEAKEECQTASIQGRRTLESWLFGVN